MKSRFWKIVAAFWAFVHRDSIATAAFALDRWDDSLERADRARPPSAPPA